MGFSTWETNDATNTILLQNGAYALRLVARDKAGNSRSVSVPVNTNNLQLTGVSASTNEIDTSQAQTVSIFYTISSAATVTLRIVPEKLGPGGPAVYQSAQNSAVGAGVFTWNGRDNTGKAVPDEAYLYVLDAAAGTRTDTYSPSALTGTGTVTCSQSTGCDPVKNIPMTVTFTPAQSSRVNINIHWGVFSYKVLDAFPATPASHTFVWDGRSPNNKLLDWAVYSSCSIASLLRENHIITTGDTITVTDLETDPYAMHVAYGQFTRITYSLSRDANVTIAITSPSGTSMILISNQFQTAGPQSLEWNGVDVSDSTGKKTLVAEEGDYMVSVQTVNPATGSISITRANLRIGY